MIAAESGVEVQRVGGEDQEGYKLKKNAQSH